MKKFLSIVLALTMIFSTVSFAAPAMVGTVETAAETVAVAETAEVEANVQGETVTITFNNGGVEGAEFVGSVGADGSVVINNGAAFDPEYYSYKNTSGKLFKGWKKANGESVWKRIYPTTNIELTAQWEDAYSEDYGTLVAAVDFEKPRIGNGDLRQGWKLSVSQWGVRPDTLPQNFPEEIYFLLTAEEGLIESTTDNNKYLLIKSSRTDSADSKLWPRVSFRPYADTDENGLFPEGTYTMVWTIKDDETRTVNSSVAYKESNIYWWNGSKYAEVNSDFSQKSTTVITEGSRTGWNATVASRAILKGENVMDGLAFQGIGTFQAMPTIRATEANADGKYTFTSYVMVDDVKLYYRAPINITYADPKGYADSLPEAGKVKYGENYTISTDIPTCSDHTASFEGWSYEENGNVITAKSLTALTEDVTLYAVWAEGENHPQYGKMLFSLDFENVDSINYDDSSNFKLYHYGYTNTDDDNSRNWYLKVGGASNNASVMIYSENAAGQIIYKNGVKQESDSITDYEVANKYIGFDTAYRWPQIQLYSTAASDTNTDNDYAPEGYYTLFSKTAYHYGVVDGKKPNTIGVTPGYQFRPTTFYPDGTTNTEGTAVKITQDNVYSHQVHTGSGAKPAEDEWHYRGATSTGDFSITSKLTDIEYDSRTGVRYFLINYDYSGNGLVENGVDLLKFDDIVAYWKPYKANLTINMVEDNGLTLNGLTDYDTMNIVSLASLLGDNVNTIHNGRIFKGLSKTQGGALITEDFYLTEDTTLYAVWSDDYTGTAPTTSTENSIRTDSNHGIRFKASVLYTQKAVAQEYGFIVTRASKITSGNYKDLTFDSGIAYASGKAYDKETGTEFIYGTTATEVIFTGVLTNMPASKENYSEEIVARPYIKYNDGTYAYGEPHARSILSVAETLRDGGFKDMTQAAIDKVQDILEICGVPNEKDALLTANGDNGQLYNFTCSQGTVKIVDDTLNSGRGKVYYTEIPENTEGYNYFLFSGIKFEAGATYEISYDFLPAPTDSTGADVTSTEWFKDTEINRQISSNITYTCSVSGHDRNHNSNPEGLTGKFSAVTSPDEWVSLSFTAKIDDSYTWASSNYFGMYIEPRAHIKGDNTTTKWATAYYIDNLRIVKIADAETAE